MLVNLMSGFNIDGDNLRKHFPPEGGYNPDGRRENIRRAQKLAAMMAEQIDCVVVSLVSPFRDMREEFKAEHEVFEVYLHTSEKRGRESYFVEDYEPPEQNYLKIDTGEMSENQALFKIVSEMEAGGWTGDMKYSHKIIGV